MLYDIILITDDHLPVPLFLSLFWMHFPVEVAEIAAFHAEINGGGRRPQGILAKGATD